MAELLERGTPVADVEADVEALLEIGAPFAKVEELFGKEVVVRVARRMVAGDRARGEEASGGSRLRMATSLLTRSRSTAEAALGDEAFVSSLLDARPRRPPFSFGGARRRPSLRRRRSRRTRPRT